MLNGAVRRMRTGAAMLVAMGALSCGGDSTGPDQCPANATLQINAFPAEGPRFEWVPKCLISELVVFEEGTGQEMWTIFSTGAGEPNTIGSGVVYGTVPDDADQTGAAQALVPGTTYRVTLSATNNGSVDAIGTRTFVR